MRYTYEDYLKETLFYSFARRILICIGKAVFRVSYEGRENVPEKGGVVLAGNHSSYLDWLLHITALKRPVHFMGKVELYQGKFPWVMKEMGIIPVDRSIHDREAMRTAMEGLVKGKVIGIFPEGTINRTEDTVMPFKFGAVRMAALTKCPVVPFTSTGKFRPFRRGPVLTFYPPIYPEGEDLTGYNEQLTEVVRSNLEIRRNSK